MSADQQSAKILDINDLTRRVEGNTLDPGHRPPRRRDQVLLRKNAVDLVGRDAELGHRLLLHLDVDRFLNVGQDRNPFDVLHPQDLDLQHLGDLVELRELVAVAGQNDVHAVDIAEIVVDDRRSGSWRKLPLVVVDLAPQLVPDLGQTVLIVLVLDRDLHVRQTAGGPRLDPLDLAELLGSRLNLVGYLLLDLLGGSTGVWRQDDGIFDRELGVFEARELLEGHVADDQKGDGHDPGHDGVTNRVFGDVHRGPPLTFPVFGSSSRRADSAPPTWQWSRPARGPPGSPRCRCRSTHLW